MAAVANEAKKKTSTGKEKEDAKKRKTSQEKDEAKKQKANQEKQEAKKQKEVQDKQEAKKQKASQEKDEAKKQKASQEKDAAKKQKASQEKDEAKKQKASEEKQEAQKQKEVPDKQEAKKQKEVQGKEEAKNKEKEEDDSGKRLLKIQAELKKQSLPSPRTPPVKRLRMKSPSESSTKTDASAWQYSSRLTNQQRAVNHLAQIRGNLEEAMKAAEDEAEMDGAGMLEFFSSMKEEVEQQQKEKLEKNVSNNENLKNIKGAEEEASEEASASEKGDLENEAGEEEDANEGDEEGEEEDQEEDQEVEAENEKDDSEDEASSELSRDSFLDTILEEKDEQVISSDSESQKVSEEGSEEEEAVEKEEGEGGEGEGEEEQNPEQDLTKAVESTKQDIFGLFLDFDGDWDKVECEAQRWTRTKNLARKDWTAVQAKTLKQQLDEDKFNALIKKREDAGLCYPDYDWPDDPLDRLLRQDDETGEQTKATARKRLSQDMFNALTGETGPLPAGALPSIKAASEQGKVAMFQAMDDDGKEAAKVGKPKKAKQQKNGEAEEVEPKTVAESAKSQLGTILDQATKARGKSIQLGGIEYAAELGGQLLKHAVTMESRYNTLKKAIQDSDEAEMKRVMKKVEKAGEWYTKAEVGVHQNHWG
eukprot:Skav214601  [mRNA]  locus=scaffold57:783253:786317:+ [translate_table: standard]